MIANRRFTDHYAAEPDSVAGLPADHPAVTQARTIFPSTVIPATQSPRLLVSGLNQRKIGDRVTKGAWAGMPIYCLTLQERATCPETCHHWRTCYGNSMPFSRRHEHGSAFEFLLEAELREKQQRHPAGFVIRLHILGDFYDSAYVALWSRWLEQFPALRAFGFTARDEMSDEGILIRMLNRDHPERWVIRFSRPAAGRFPGARYATTIWHVPEGPTEVGAVVCPAQTGRTACCGTCAFCWAGSKPVAFIAHGRLGRPPGAPDEGEEAIAEPDLTMLQKSLPAPLRAATAPATAPRTPDRANTQPPRKTVPVISGMVDHGAPVPLRAIEIRAWLMNLGIATESLQTAGDLLACANHERRRMALPPFRLIPEHEATGRFETIMPARGFRQ